MQIAVCIRWRVIVDDNVHALDVNTTSENIRCDENSLLECLECSVPLDSAESSPIRQGHNDKGYITPLLLGESRVNADAGEVVVP